MTKLISLYSRNGDALKHVVVDDEDYARVSALRWTFAARNVAGPDGGYAVHTSLDSNGKTYRIYMHRFILNAPCGIQVDHRNGRTLTNTRSNLRLATNAQNIRNQSKARIICTSKYKGVNLVPMQGRRTKGRERWRANINVNYKRLHLGYFASELDAARAYNAAAILHFGEFARLNEV